MKVGSVVARHDLTGVVVSMTGTWFDVLWDHKVVYYSGGPLGPPGPLRLTKPEAWPESCLSEVVCPACETAGEDVPLTKDNTTYCRDGQSGKNRRQHFIEHRFDDAPKLHGPVCRKENDA